MTRPLAEIAAGLRLLMKSGLWRSEYHAIEAAVCCEEPARQKQIIMIARHPDVAVISDETAEALIRDLGLQEA